MFFRYICGRLFTKHNQQILIQIFTAMDFGTAIKTASTSTQHFRDVLAVPNFGSGLC